jgi:hypothetical protein
MIESFLILNFLKKSLKALGSKGLFWYPAGTAFYTVYTASGGGLKTVLHLFGFPVLQWIQIIKGGGKHQLDPV